MHDMSTDPSDAIGLTDEEEAMLDRELEEFRKTLSGYAKLAAEHPQLIRSLRENLAFSAKHIVSNRAEFVEEYRDAGERLDRFLEEFEQGKLDPRNFILDEDQ